MLTLRNTENFAGIEISGDFLDLDSLYTALHIVVGDEGEFGDYEGARLRVLGLCYDLRHALMGEGDVEFVENGLNADQMKRMALVALDKNLYYKTRVYYPEALFVTIALNDFIHLYARKQAKTAPFPLLDKRNVWDSSIANIRVFQSEISTCIQQAVTESSFSRMMNLMHKNYPWTDSYATQYVDMLNIRYLNMDNDQRKKGLPTMAKRLVEQGKEYKKVEREVTAMAREHNCSVENIGVDWDYPKNIDW